MHIMVNIHGEN